MVRLTNWRATAVLAVTGSLLLGAFATAPPTGASTIYACVKKKSGTAHFVAQKTKCKKGETKLSWNSVGPAGKNGTNGANGAPGSVGPVGPAGPAGPAKTLSFTALPLENGWTDAAGIYGTNPVGYALDGFGIVHLRGGVVGTSATTNIIAQLPPSVRPKGEVYAISWGFDTNGPAFVNVEPNGDILVWDQGAKTTNVKEFASLEDVTFFAG